MTELSVGHFVAAGALAGEDWRPNSPAPLGALVGNPRAMRIQGFGEAERAPA